MDIRLMIFEAILQLDIGFYFGLAVIFLKGPNNKQPFRGTEAENI